MGDLPVIAFGWTLEFEMFFYLVISVALILPFKRKIYLVTAFLIFTVVVMGMPQTVLNFGIGLIVYLAVKSQRVTKKWGFGLVILSVTYFAFTWSISGNGFLQPGWLLYGVPTGLLVLGLSSTGLGSRPKLFVELGNASYSIYLSQWFCWFAIGWLNNKKLFPLAIGSDLFILLAVPFTITFGYAVYRLLEKPLDKRLKVVVAQW